MVDSNTQNSSQNSNYTINLMNNPFLTQEKNKSYSQINIEITPFEKLTEIENNLKLLDTIKFTINKIRKN